MQVLLGRNFLSWCLLLFVLLQARVSLLSRLLPLLAAMSSGDWQMRLATGCAFRISIYFCHPRQPTCYQGGPHCLDYGLGNAVGGVGLHLLPNLGLHLAALYACLAAF